MIEELQRTLFPMHSCIQNRTAMMRNGKNDRRTAKNAVPRCIHAYRITQHECGTARMIEELQRTLFRDAFMHTESHCNDAERQDERKNEKNAVPMHICIKNSTTNM